jgi:hypothetical protein
MKKSDRKDIHTALVAAKKHLLTAEDIRKNRYVDKTQYICFAIDRAYVYNNITMPTAKLACGMIMERIDNPTLESWVQAHIGLHAFSNCSASDFQAYRWRWLNSMIEEFSK